MILDSDKTIMTEYIRIHSQGRTRNAQLAGVEKRKTFSAI